MRLMYRTLDHLPKQKFQEELLIARQAEGEEPGYLRATAESYNMSDQFNHWETVIAQTPEKLSNQQEPRPPDCSGQTSSRKSEQMDATATTSQRGDRAGTALGTAKTITALIFLAAALALLAISVPNLTAESEAERVPPAPEAPSPDPELLLAVQEQGVDRRHSLQAYGQIPKEYEKRFEGHMNALANQRGWYVLARHDRKPTGYQHELGYNLAIPHQDANLIQSLERNTAETLQNLQDLPPPAEAINPEDMLRVNLRVGLKSRDKDFLTTAAGVAGICFALTMLLITRRTNRNCGPEDTAGAHWITGILLAAAIAGAVGTGWKLHQQSGAETLPEAPANSHSNTELMLQMQKERFNGKSSRPLVANLSLPSTESDRLRQGMSALTAQRGWQILNLAEGKYPHRYMDYTLALPAQDAALIADLEQDPAQALSKHLKQPPQSKPNPDSMLAAEVNVGFERNHGPAIGIAVSTGFAIILAVIFFALPAGRPETWQHRTAPK